VASLTASVAEAVIADISGKDKYYSIAKVYEK
jgi:hypothetical protein